MSGEALKGKDNSIGDTNINKTEKIYVTRLRKMCVNYGYADKNREIEWKRERRKENRCTERPRSNIKFENKWLEAFSSLFN